MYRKIMRWVERHILKCPFQVLAFIMLLGSSCGSHRSSVKTKSQTQSSVNILDSDTFSVSSSGNTVTEESFDETTTTYRVEYDTAQPVLESTGKPPVKSEETTSRHREASRKSEAVNTSEVTDKSDTSVSADSQSQESDDTKKTGSHKFPWVVLIIALAICVSMSRRT